MYDLSTIRSMNARAARKAGDKGIQPLIYDGNPETLRKIPNMGNYRATRYGWKMVKKYFVDSSGVGAEGEPALTFNQFVKEAVVGRGYGIIEEGQFQVRIGEFVKTKRKKS